MFLTEKRTGELVEVLSENDLFDPFRQQIVGRYNAGEELPDPRMFEKGDLCFCSHEPLPECWLNPDYRQAGMKSTGTFG